MADVTKDSFVEAQNHAEVLFQRDRPVADFELNEAQRIQRVGNVRTMEDFVQKAFGGEDFSPGSNDEGYMLTALGPNEVGYAPGSLAAEGTRVVTAGGILNLTPWAGPGPTTYAIYLKLEEVEVPDPAALSTIGALSMRRKLVVTVLESTTGIGGVPASSPLDIWQGGVKYVPVGTIVRRAGDASVFGSDITDLRRLLPSSVLAQIHKQVDFEVTAVVGPQFQSTEGPVDFVAYPNGAIPPPGGLSEVTRSYEGVRSASTKFSSVVRYQPSAPSVTDKQYSGVLNGNAASGDTSGAVGASAGLALSFVDKNIGYDYPLPLTDEDNESARVMETLYRDGGIKRSVLSSVNARWGVTVGDGISTFGDFNGFNAVMDAWTHFLDSVYIEPGLAIVVDCEIFVKPGLYNSTGIIVPEGVHLKVVGQSAGQTVIRRLANSVGQRTFTVSASGRLSLKGVTVSCEAATTPSEFITSCIFTSGHVEMTDCITFGGVMVRDVLLPTAVRKQGGLYSRGCVFNAEHDPLVPGSFDSYCVTVSAMATTPPTGGDQGIYLTFEDCAFVAHKTDGMILRFLGTSSTPTRVELVSFKQCLFRPSEGYEVDQGSGIVTVEADGPNAGKLSVGRLSFEKCAVTRISGENPATVFDLDASNDAGNGTAVYFEHVSMRDCDWRVNEQFNRSTTPWHFGEYSTETELSIGGTAWHSINNLTIESTRFGFVPNGTDPAGTNKYGSPRGLAITPYDAALNLHADKIVVRDVAFEGGVRISGSAEVLFAGVRDLSVDGLTVSVDSGGGTAEVLPAHRVMFYSSTGNAPGARQVFNRYINKFVFKTFPEDVSGVRERGLVAVLPGGQMDFSHCHIMGSKFDSGMCLMPATAEMQAITTENWDYCGLHVSDSMFTGLRIAFDSEMPTSGSITQVENCHFSRVTFQDVKDYMFWINEEDPTVETEYHTSVVDFRFDHCVNKAQSPMPGGVFHIGRPLADGDTEASSVPYSTPWNLSLIGNYFGNDSHVMSRIRFGADGASFVEPLAYFMAGNTMTAQPILSGLGRSHGLETGYSGTGGSMHNLRLWGNAQNMIHNHGILIVT